MDLKIGCRDLSLTRGGGALGNLDPGIPGLIVLKYGDFEKASTTAEVTAYLLQVESARLSVEHNLRICISKTLLRIELLVE